MKGVWILPPNYVSIPIVEGGTCPHRYRIFYEGQDNLVQVQWDTGNVGLGSGTTIDVTAQWIRIAPTGDPRAYALSGEYEALD
jgi:hypothetical protein